MKAKMHMLVTLAAAAMVATAVRADPHRADASTDRQIRRCVAEIARHANFSDAARVVYWVESLEQRNLEELEIRIRTSVYAPGAADALRSYRAACVTGTPGELVRFEISTARQAD